MIRKFRSIKVYFNFDEYFMFNKIEQILITSKSFAIILKYVELLLDYLKN